MLLKRIHLVCFSCFVSSLWLTSSHPCGTMAMNGIKVIKAGASPMRFPICFGDWRHVGWALALQPTGLRIICHGTANTRHWFRLFDRHHR